MRANLPMWIVTLALVGGGVAYFVTLPSYDPDRGIAGAAEAALEPGTPKPGTPVPAFKVTPEADGANKQEIDSRAAGSPVTVWAFLGTTCPTTRAYLERLHAVEETYAKKGVRFVYFYPNKGDAPENELRFHHDAGLQGPLVDDNGGKVASLFGASKTAEMVVTDAKGVIAYRGAIDDSKNPKKVKRAHLAVALDEILAARPVTVPITQVFA